MRLSGERKAAWKADLRGREGIQGGKRGVFPLTFLNDESITSITSYTFETENTKEGTDMNPRKRFAATVKVGEKGQFVVPKEIREMFDIQPGDTLLLLADTKRGIAVVKDGEVFSRFASKLGEGPEGDEEGEEA